MTNSDETTHRSFYQPDAGRVYLREDEAEDGVFSVRMPIATTGDVRNEGDDPLTRDELGGMREQLETQAIGVFLDHGKNPDVAGSRYSATEKVGEWQDAALESRDGADETELVASAVMMDPDTLSGDTGALREALASLKAQVERGFSLSSSIGWKGDDSAPGGNDLMEASIVGIPADPRTTSQDAAVAQARDVLADADLPDEKREELVENFRAVVMGSDSETQEMTDDNDPSGDDPDGTNDSTDGTDSEYREFMRDQQEQQTEILRTLSEALREDGEDEEEGDDEDEDDDEDEQSSEPEDTQDTDVDELRSEIEDLREKVNNADPANPEDQGESADPDGEQDGETDETNESETPDSRNLLK